jgi:predicted ATP-grasp superfamily ATP-dependent carboligase
VILLWGVPGDSPMAAVRAALARLGRRSFFVDQHDLLETDIELRVGSRVEGRITTADAQVDLADVEAVYVRPYDIGRLLAMAGTRLDTDAWAEAVAVDDALTSWADLTPAFVVNRPSAMAANASKPYQAAWIQRFGFDVPDSVTTTDPAVVREFRDRHPAVIYKSISGVRSIVARLTEADDARIEDVVWCPTQFQEYVRGRDVRVHVVGNEVFGCRVSSDADDYRYPGRNGHDVRLEPCPLSAEVTARCLAMSNDMGLFVSGIDLRETTDGRWYCFEVNPSPGFTYFAAATGQPIAYAVAHLLAAGHEPAGWSPPSPAARGAPISAAPAPAA